MMLIACRCLNVMINSKGAVIETHHFGMDNKADHPFFKENIGVVELINIHKEQSTLVEVDIYGEWVINRCLNCGIYTHALDKASTATVLVNRAMLTKPQEIAALKKSEKYSPAYHILIESSEEDVKIPFAGVRYSAAGTALQQQLTEWIKRETAQTEERVRQFTDQQYELLDQLRARVHRDHHTLSRILATNSHKSVPSVSQLASVTGSQLSPFLPEPDSAITPVKKPAQAATRPKNLPRKPSVDAEGLFDLEGMDESTETFVSDEELSDTDDSGSHDEGIHIPRHVSTVYAKSLPVNVPTFMNQLGSQDSPQRHTETTRERKQPMDIAASIKALAKSVHGDAVFGDLPRPRFSSQI